MSSFQLHRLYLFREEIQLHQSTVATMSSLSREEVSLELVGGTLVLSIGTSTQQLLLLGTNSSLSYLITITTMTIQGAQRPTCSHKTSSVAGQPLADKDLLSIKFSTGRLSMLMAQVVP